MPRRSRLAALLGASDAAANLRSTVQLPGGNEMSTLMSRYALRISVAAALLAGCGASPTAGHRAWRDAAKPLTQ
jgi:hypothetical protein